MALCLPPFIAHVGRARGYLGVGLCPGHTRPLLKQLIAVPGDHVRVTENALIVNGQRYLAPRQRLDTQHRSVMRFIQRGDYPMVHGFWVYGAHAPLRS